MTPRKASGLSRRWGMIMAVRPQRCGTRARASGSMMPAFQHSIRQNLSMVHFSPRESVSQRCGVGRMQIKSKDFRVREGVQVDLQEWPTNVPAIYASKADYYQLLQDHVKQLSKQQQLLYAS